MTNKRNLTWWDAPWDGPLNPGLCSELAEFGASPHELVWHAVNPLAPTERACGGPLRADRVVTAIPKDDPRDLCARCYGDLPTQFAVLQVRLIFQRKREALLVA